MRLFRIESRICGALTLGPSFVQQALIMRRFTLNTLFTIVAQLAISCKFHGICKKAKSLGPVCDPP
jgi:hypothetical protein